MNFNIQMSLTADFGLARHYKVPVDYMTPKV